MYMLNTNLFLLSVATVPLVSVTGFTPGSFRPIHNQIQSESSTTLADLLAASKQSIEENVTTEEALADVGDDDDAKLKVSGRNNIVKSTDREKSKSKKKQQQNKNKKKLKNVKLGETVRGRVVSIKDFGVFIRTNFESKSDALLHISQISNERIEDIRDHFAIGQMVEARVIKVDYDKGEVAVSTRPRRPDRYKISELRDLVGQTVEGKVKSITSYGAFIDIGCKDGDGLLHVSRLSDNKVNDIHDFVKVGKKIDVRIYKVDVPNKKIEVSLRSLSSDRYHDKRRQRQEKWKQIAEEVAAL